MLYIPYKGVTPALNDLFGGHVPAAIVSLAAALPHIQSGQLRLLTVFDTKRYSKLPNVPIISEEVPRFEPGRAWVGFLAPRDLPAAIAARLHREIVRILNLADVQQVLDDNGLEIIANTPADSPDDRTRRQHLERSGRERGPDLAIAERWRREFGRAPRTGARPVRVMGSKRAPVTACRQR